MWISRFGRKNVKCVKMVQHITNIFCKVFLWSMDIIFFNFVVGFKNGARSLRNLKIDLRPAPKMPKNALKSHLQLLCQNTAWAPLSLNQCFSAANDAFRLRKSQTNNPKLMLRFIFKVWSICAKLE